MTSTENYLEQLCSSAWAEVEIGIVKWRLRKMDTALAAQAKVLLQLLGVVTRQSKAENEMEAALADATSSMDAAVVESAMKRYAAALRLSEADRAPSNDEVSRIEAAILCSCVKAIKVGDEAWMEVSIVHQVTQQNHKAKRVWVDSLDASTKGILIAAALAHVLEARQELRPFRFRPQVPAVAGPGGEAIPLHAE